MSLFYNDYQKIRQDNKDENVKLKTENRKAIERMTEYISFNNVSLFELEVIKKDLIGLAAEAEEEGVAFLSKLGMAEKEFCDSLLAGAMKRNRFERVLLLIRNLSIATCIVTTYLCVSTGFPEKFGLITSMMVSASIFAIVLELIGFDRIVGKKLVYSEKRSTKAIVIAMAIAFLIFFYFDVPVDHLIYGNSIVITAITIVVTVIIFLLNSFYWNKQSEKYSWR